jgi:hypothetical protein
VNPIPLSPNNSFTAEHAESVENTKNENLAVLSGLGDLRGK